MFSKSKKNNDQQPSDQSRSVPSIISSDLQIVGDLESAGEVQIDGEVSGDIRARVLLVGESATITGGNLCRYGARAWPGQRPD